MLRLVVAVALSAVLQFAWGFVFWMILPLSKEMVQRLPDEEKVVQALREAGPESGVYFLPYPECRETQDSEKKEAFLERHRQGPLVQIVYHKDGIEPMNPATFAMGFGHYAVASLLAGLLLLLAAPALNGYCARLLFVFGLGVFAAVAIHMANPIWFHHPWKFSLLQSVYDVGSWAVAGVVLAALVRRQPA